MSPFDRHKGLMFGMGIGGGVITFDGCDMCDVRPGIAIDGSIGWFLSPRFALMYDATGAIGLFSESFSSLGVALQSLALQYWLHVYTLAPRSSEE